MLFNFDQIIIGSDKELFAFNVNNAIVEEKFNLENSTLCSNMMYFFFSLNFDQLFSVDLRGFVVGISHNGDKNSDI